MRAVGITAAVAKISGNGNDTRIDSLTIRPRPDIRIKGPTDGGRTQVRAADAVEAVVEETVADLRFPNGHSARYGIGASTGNTRPEMHADRGWRGPGRADRYALRGTVRRPAQPNS